MSDDIVPISTSNKTFGSKSHFYDLETGGDIYRTFDTEVQFNLDFINNHLMANGSHFNIKITSSLQACNSCKEHVLTLERQILLNNKTSTIIFESHPDATQIKFFNEKIVPIF
ncbi:MAG: hypothetical protein ACI8UQ_001889 [Bacteroidia bacterium]